MIIFGWGCPLFHLSSEPHSAVFPCSTLEMPCRPYMSPKSLQTLSVKMQQVKERGYCTLCSTFDILWYFATFITSVWSKTWCSSCDWFVQSLKRERERVQGQFSVCRGWRQGDCWSLINVNHCFMLFRSWFFQTWCLWSFCQLHPRRRTQPESWAERPWGPKTGHFRKCETWRPTAVAKHFSGNVLEVIYQCRACGNG
jgi:hypothetical protein